jgi:hypothetical protein
LKTNSKINILAFNIAFPIYYIATALQYTNFISESNSTFFDNLKLVAYVIAGIAIVSKIKINSRKLYRYLALIILIVLLIYGTIIFDERTYLPTILFGLAIPDISIDKYLKKCWWILSVIYFATIIASAIGIISNVEINSDLISSNVGIQRGTRFSLGFEYPGQSMLAFIPIVILDYYLHRKVSRMISRNIIWIILSTIVFYYSRTIAPYVVIILFIIFFNVIKKREGKMRHRKNYITFICCGISLIAEWLYIKGSSLMRIIDFAINGRLSTSARVIDRVGISLLGTDFTNGIYNGNYLYLDSDYMAILVKNGLILLIILMIIYNRCVNYCAKNNLRYLELIFSIYAVFAIIDNGMFSLYFNPFIILMINILLDRKINYDKSQVGRGIVFFVNGHSLRI